MKKGKNVLVAQSGGPTSVINATLSGIIMQSLESCEVNKIYGLRYGIEGAIKDEAIELTKIFSNKENIDRLSITPGAALGSCRYKLSLNNEINDDYKKIAKFFDRYSIEYFLYIGGNDSMDTVNKLSEYFKRIGHPARLIGVPKTIDNDLIGTDHTPGFGSAAKYVMTTVQDIIRDAASYSEKSLTVIEIMGRDAGWLTAASAMGRIMGGDFPDLVYLPEVVFDINECLDSVKKLISSKKHVVVSIAEGVKNENGQYVGADNEETDKFGHVRLSGAGRALAYAARKKLGCKCRAVELNVMQRCFSKMISEVDFNESILIGREALNIALKGYNAKMAAFERLHGTGYNIEVKAVDVSYVANKTKTVNFECVEKEGDNVRDSLLQYIKPIVISDKDEQKVHFSDYFKIEA